MEMVSDRPVAKKNDAITSYIAGESEAARRFSIHEVWDILSSASSSLTDTEIWEANQFRFARGLSDRRWTRQRLGTAAVDLRDIYNVVENGPIREHGAPEGGPAQTWRVAGRSLAVVVPFYRDEQYDACWAQASGEASLLAQRSGFVGVRYESDELVDAASVGLPVPVPAGMRFRRFVFEAVAA